MGEFYQAAALAMVAAVLVLVLQKQSRELAVLLAIAGCVAVMLLAMQFLEPVVDFVSHLQSLGQLDGGMVSILLKVAGIGLVAELAATVCEDAGEAALGKMARLCGTAAALYLSLPMLTAVLELLQKMLEV